MISTLRKAGKTVADIASTLGRHRSTIYRECTRNVAHHVARGLTVIAPARQRSNATADCGAVVAAVTMAPNNTRWAGT